MDASWRVGVGHFGPIFGMLVGANGKWWKKHARAKFNSKRVRSEGGIRMRYSLSSGSGSGVGKDKIQSGQSVG